MLRILIAEDHDAVRRGLRSLVESHPGWNVVGEATNGRDAIEHAGRLQPDVVLLDVVMPALNGIEAMREILKMDPRPQVLILTTHQSEELSRDVIRGGADAIVTKSAAHEALVPAIESLVARKEGIHVAGSVWREQHVAVLCRSKAEAYAVLDPFIIEGIRQGDKVAHLMDPGDRDDLARRLSIAGLDIRRMEFIPWSELSFPDGSIEYSTVRNFWENLRRRAAAEGFPRVRIIGYMDWLLGARGGLSPLANYEEEIDRFLHDFQATAACAYDLSKFDSAVIDEVARTHPSLVVDESLVESPSYERPSPGPALRSGPPSPR